MFLWPQKLHYGEICKHYPYCMGIDCCETLHERDCETITHQRCCEDVAQFQTGASAGAHTALYEAAEQNMQLTGASRAR